ncbi:succinate dehydrogenase, hydrophobic membrane anchor protein [Sphingobium sufflavum]|uniref:succinate dehydrogenase, hydrophobic membrane anchor protein n=1 Tax=Sphingobium sufflavum TaxID=1129547 RepID=UPI001F293876|nr:succinate dehydrogenase, hydrophobic membrane anchor protein [Sphingobium sufflavum]MCE7797573.1 succinate dehydrogenase, hydrophobic membrane anchor protein [Sphingobium sufflavum]
MGGGTRVGRVRGLGSAKTGTHHWIVQRITAIGNLVLVLWLIASLLVLPGLDYGAVTGWLAQPLVAVPAMLMLISIFWHLKLGLQVLIEDYLHEEATKLFALLLLNFYAIGAPALGIFSIAKIAFTGTAG